MNHIINVKLLLNLSILILLFSCFEINNSKEDDDCTGKIIVLKKFPGDFIAVDKFSMLPLDGWCTFKNESMTKRIKFENGLKRDIILLNEIGDTIEITKFIEGNFSYYVSKKDTLEKPILTDKTDTLMINEFMSNFKTKNIPELTNAFTGQLSEFDFNKVFLNLKNLYGDIDSLVLVGMQKIIYKSDNYPITLHGDFNLICKKDTISMNVSFFMDSHKKTVISFSFKPINKSIAERWINSESKINKLDLKVSDDINTFNKLFYQNPFFIDKNYFYEFNGISIINEGAGYLLESITVYDTGADKAFSYVYLLYTWDGSAYKILSRTIATPIEYQPMWIISN